MIILKESSFEKLLKFVLKRVDKNNRITIISTNWQYVNYSIKNNER